MRIPIQKIIDNDIAEKNKDREKKIQNHWYVSQIGSCMRGNYLQRLGVKPLVEVDARTLRVFEVGNRDEEYVVNKLKKQTEYNILTQERVKSKELDISGYIDAISEMKNNKNDRWVYEIKSKHSRSFWYMDKKGQGAQKEHQYQLWTYLYLLKAKEGSIVYVSKDDLTILEFPILLNNEELEKEVLDYLNLMNRAWKLQDPLLLPLPDEKSWQSNYCRYHKYCQDEEYLKNLKVGK